MSVMCYNMYQQMTKRSVCMCGVDSLEWGVNKKKKEKTKGKKKNPIII